MLSSYAVLSSCVMWSSYVVLSSCVGEICCDE